MVALMSLELVGSWYEVVLALAVVGGVVLCCGPWYSTEVRGAQWKAFSHVHARLQCLAGS